MRDANSATVVQFPENLKKYVITPLSLALRYMEKSEKIHFLSFLPPIIVYYVQGRYTIPLKNKLSIAEYRHYFSDHRINWIFLFTASYEKDTVDKAFHQIVEIFGTE